MLKKIKKQQVGHRVGWFSGIRVLVMQAYCPGFSPHGKRKLPPTLCSLIHNYTDHGTQASLLKHIKRRNLKDDLQTRRKWFKISYAIMTYLK